MAEVAGPSWSVEIDLSSALPEIARRGFDRAYVVVRMCGRMLGTVAMSIPASAEEVAEAVEGALGGMIARELHAHKVPRSPLTSAGFPHGECPARAARSEIARSGPGLSVVLCTRNRAWGARRCVESLLDADYPALEIVVVDNAPSDDATARALAGLDITYVREDLPGLSRARNAGVRAASHELIAFVDDDEVVDPQWATAVVEEFVADAGVDAVTGLVLPLHLETAEAVAFERFGGHSKGRGARRWVFDRQYLQTVQSAYFPKPTFGCGANMAFRREAIERFGYFDTALGAGTATKGAEDTLALSETMLNGSTVVYSPHAITRHEHRATSADLAAQLGGYGIGIGAFYTALLVRRPVRIFGLVAAALRIFGAALRKPRAGSEVLGVSRPGLRLHHMARGPGIYLRTRREQRG